MGGRERDSRIQINGLIHTNGGEAARGRQAQIEQPPVHVYFENGREYCCWGQTLYPFPIDEDQSRCTDILHCLVHDVVLKHRAYTTNAQLPPPNQHIRVLDVGCGTGIWCMDMAKANPLAEVCGIDLHTRQPANIDESCRLEIPVDFTQPNWPFPEDSFDFVRASRLCGSVPNWWKLYYNMFRYIKPKTGYMEHIEFDWTPRCSNSNGLPEQARPIQQWWDYMKNASRAFGKPMELPGATVTILTSVGFTDINHRLIPIKLKPSLEDPQELAIEDQFKTAMVYADPNGTLVPSFEAMSMFLLTRYLEFDPRYVQHLCSEVRRLCHLRLPIYFNIHIWTARKPMS